MQSSRVRKLELFWIVRDLTEQIKAEEILRESEESYRTLFENALEGICRTTPAGSFVSCNPALTKMLGYAGPGDAPLPEASALYADASERIRLLREVDTSPEGAIRGREVLLKKSDGRPLVASVSIRAVRDKKGATVAYESLVQDVTERKHLEEHLRQRERLAAVGSTVAVLAHEISNPLTGMYTAIQLLESQLARKEAEHGPLLSTVRDLSTETRRLCDLVSDFRLLAQADYSFDPFSLSDLVVEIMNIQSLNYGALGIRVQLDLPGDLPAITGDKNKLKQALLNLCKNAVEAMPGGGTLAVRVRGRDDSVLLEVSDTGTGVPEGVELFEPFVTTKEYGTGVGLPLVKQIVSAHGGAVTYESQPGKGTSFRVTLPVRQHN
jgi:PAS domain S-box-containing protein